MGKISETEEYFFQQILKNTDMTGRDVRILMTDLIYAFKSDIPSYNKELEEENARLKDQVSDLMELLEQSGLKALELVGEIKNTPVVYSRSEVR